MEGTGGAEVGQAEGAELADGRDEALGSEILYRSVAWPVAERMLQMLASSPTLPGFTPTNFAKECFEDTFGSNVPSIDTAFGHARNGEVPKNRGFSVVDNALGVMGYSATAIQEAKTRLLVDMLASFVQSRLPCGSHLLASTRSEGYPEDPRNSQAFENVEYKACNQSISTSVLFRMVEKCAPFLISGKAQGSQIFTVLDAIVRGISNWSSFTPRSGHCRTLYTRATCASQGQAPRKCPARVMQHLEQYALHEKDTIYSKLPPQARLRFWRLRPSCLKRDLSCVAQEAMDRILLPLQRELHERQEWATLVVCLALAPDIFVEARRLLHTWFISSGAIRLWKLRAELAAALRNVLSQPSMWGLTEEVHLPHLHSFYSPHLRPFILILRWAPTYCGLVKLVSLLDQIEGVDRRLVESPTTLDRLKSPVGGEVAELPFSTDPASHNSVWTLLQDFVPWLYFASRLLFARRHRQPSPQLLAEMPQDMPRDLVTTETLDIHSLPLDCSKLAARYIAWIMNPLDCRQRRSDEQLLLQLSSSWEKVSKVEHGDHAPMPDAEILNASQVSVDDELLRGATCRVSAGPAKRHKREENGEPSGTGNDEPVIYRAMAALDLWLNDLQTNLSSNNQGLGTGMTANADRVDRKTEVDSREANPLKFQIQRNQKSVMMSMLPLGALVESLPFRSPNFATRLLQFVMFESHHFQNVLTDPSIPDEGKQHHYSGCSPRCSGGHNEVTSSGREKHANLKGDDPRLDGDYPRATTSFRVREECADWIPGAAAVFDFLESLHDDDYLSQAINHSKTKTKETTSRANEKLAAVVSIMVKEWVKIFETYSSSGALAISASKRRHITTLEDIRRRYCEWTDKLQLGPESIQICDNAREALDRILVISS